VADEDKRWAQACPREQLVEQVGDPTRRDRAARFGQWRALPEPGAIVEDRLREPGDRTDDLTPRRNVGAQPGLEHDDGAVATALFDVQLLTADRENPRASGALGRPRARAVRGRGK